MMRVKPVPAGRVPKARPQSPSSREAQKASATASSPKRTSSEPCNSRRPYARRCAGLGFPSRPCRRVPRAAPWPRPPPAVPLSPQPPRPSRPRASGAPTIARSTSRQMTLPDPSHTPAAGSAGTTGAGRIPRRSRHRPGTRGTRRRARGPLAGPVLHDRVRDALEGLGLLVAGSLVEALGQAHRGDGRRFDSTARSASTLAINGCWIEGLAERARPRVVDRLRQTALSHDRGRPSTQSSRVWLTISMIVRTPATLIADAAPDVVELDLAGVRAVAQLVLQTLDPEGLRPPSGAHRGTQKQDSPPGGVREHQEPVRHRCRAEPLVPGDPVLVAGPRSARRPWCWPGRRSPPASRSSPFRR